MINKDKNSNVKVEKTTENETKNTPLTIVKEEKKESKETIELSFADKMKQIKELQSLTVKLDQMEATEIKLKSFKLKSDGMNDYLSIRDDNRNEFSTSNSEVIKVVFNLIQETVTQKQIELKNKINSFSI
jgi:hypothetical protein